MSRVARRSHSESSACNSRPCAQGARASAPALLRRKRKIYSNAQMGTRQIRTFCELGADAEKLLERAMKQQGLTARARDPNPQSCPHYC
ncbi:MAG: hypothetical protein WBW03_31670 [Silvibacterium sp.]